MFCAVAHMIQLSYQAAFDPFHAMYRDLRILNAIGPLEPLFVDHVRILDFYLLFPFKISAIRLKQQHRKFRGLADDYEDAQPYGSQPESAQIFARMKPIQIAALESLAEKQIIDAAEFKSGNVIRTKISVPPALAARVSSAHASEPKLMEAISALGSEYPLLGQNGLKDRTGLLEYDMTRYEPSLVITRLVVLRSHHREYDETFHEGVNVIRGENSSGKSTILNFIYYGLGGDLADWSETALLCTSVVVEARFNGLTATLSRDISSETGRPMEIFGGPYEASLKAPRSEWIRYPYRRSTSKESFSQAIFRLLAIPEVASDVSGNLTIHQILRLLYSDQLSPVETLFRCDTRFDPPALRDAVGRLLCGSYDSRLYQNDLDIRTLTREFDALSAELKSLFAVLGRTDQSLTLDWLTAERNNLTAKQRTTQDEIERIEREISLNAGADKLSLKAQNEAYTEVQRLQTKLASIQQKRDAVNLAIADSASFIRTLEQKIAALGDASAVAEHLGDVHFSICPACLTPVAETKDDTHCHLCEADFTGGRGRDRIVPA